MNFELERMIDVSAVRSGNTYEDVSAAIDIAMKYHFINVHTFPCWTKHVAKSLSGYPDIYAGAPVGFPSGGHKTAVKILEAIQLVEDGAKEIDIVMNINRLKSGQFSLVQDELEAIIACVPSEITKKVIIEINCLSDKEMLDACALVMASGADYIKTGTGWIPGDSNLSRIEKITGFTKGRIKIKAAGGIRTLNDCIRLHELGVSRIGIGVDTAKKIMDEWKAAL